MFSFIKFILKALSILFIISLVSIGCFNRLGGKDLLINYITKYINNKLGYKVEIKGLNLERNFNLKVDSITVSDTKGKWLDIKDLSILINFSLKNFFKPGIQFSINDLIYLRNPKPPNNPPPQPDKDKSNDDKPLDFDVAINSFCIDNVEIMPSKFKGHNYSSAIGGVLKWHNKEKKLDFNTNIILPKLPALSPNKRINVETKGDYNSAENTINIEKLTSNSDIMNLKAQSKLQLNEGKYQAKSIIEADDLKKIFPDLKGKVKALIDIEGNKSILNLKTKSIGKVAYKKNAIVDLNGKTDSNIKYNNKNKILEINDLTAKTIYGDIKGDLLAKIKEKKYHANLNLTNVNLNKLTSELKGKIESKVEVDLNESRLNLKTLSKGIITYKNNGPIDITGAAEGDLNLATKNAALSLKLKNITSEAKLDYAGNSYNLSNFFIKDKYSNSIKGNLDFRKDNKTIAGDINFDGNDISNYYGGLQGKYIASIKLNALPQCDVGGSQSLSIKVTKQASEKSGPDMQLDSSGNVNFHKQDIELKNFNAKYNNINITSNAPISLKKEKEKYKFNIPKITMGSDTYVSLNGHLEHENILANIDFNLPLHTLGTQFLSKSHQVIGNISSKLTLQGNIKDPKFNGTLDIQNASYKYLDLGVGVKNISAHFVGRDNILQTNNCKFYDTKDTMHTCNSKIGLNGEKKNLNVAVNVSNFFVSIPAANLKGEVKADINLNASLTGAKLSGIISSKSLEILIPKHFDAGIPELNVVEINKDTEKTSNYAFDFDLKLKVPDKLFIKGRGLDAELAGDLEVKGPAKHVSMKGKLNTISGKYEEFGKNFDIHRGDLVFHGPMPPSPFLDVVGIYSNVEAQVSIQLNGPLAKPSLHVYSNPPLSTEEILSIILFGKNTKEIGAMQAIILAGSIRRLAGLGDTGFDVMGKARKFLGIDEVTLNFDDVNNKGSSIQIGKHLTDKVLFKVEKGSKDGTAKTMLEYDILPNITLEGALGEEGHGGVGINWKRDF